MPSKRPANSSTPGPAASSRTRAWRRGSPRGDRQMRGACGFATLARSIAAAATSARMTMPAPPPAGVSSTVRCRPIPNSRISSVSNAHSPARSASPASETPSGPGNSCGKSVSTVARQMGCSKEDVDGEDTAKSARGVGVLPHPQALRNPSVEDSCGAAGVLCGDDRPTDYEIVGAGGDRLLGAGHTRLVAGLATGQAYSRRHDLQPGADDGADALCLQAGRNDAVAARVSGEPGTTDHQIFRRSLDALLADVLGREAREHGHAQDLEARPGPACERGAHGAGVLRVDCEEGSACGSRAARRPLHRVVDVEELHVEEDALAAPCQLTRELKSPAHDELEADLVEGDGGAELFDQRPCRRHGRHIESHDQAVAGAQVHGWPAFRWCPSDREVRFPNKPRAMMRTSRSSH